jgi:RNA polymerase sigma-70 factor, ECF subfamily
MRPRIATTDGGERARFERLFAAHYAAVVKYAVRRVGVEAADEVAAETFLVAWRRLDHVPQDALPWLYGTARRVVANEHRRRGRAARLDTRVGAQAQAAMDDPGELVPETMRVHAALSSLSERDREVLRLAEWEQLTAADAARVLGCSATTFNVRLHRARRRLARALEESAPAATALVIRGGLS